MLLDALQAAGTLERYIPVDVTESMVRSCAESLVEEYPGLRVHGVIGDFERHLDHVPPAERPAHRGLPRGHDRQLPAGQPAAVAARDRAPAGPGDHLLLGTDLVKDPARWRPPTTTPQGSRRSSTATSCTSSTASCEADFDPEDFDHVALFDREQEWIEMRLRARREHTSRVRALNLTVHFDAGEELRTEISAKFTPERIEGDLAAAGLELAALVDRPRAALRADALAPARTPGALSRGWEN